MLGQKLWYERGDFKLGPGTPTRSSILARGTGSLKGSGKCAHRALGCGSPRHRSRLASEALEGHGVPGAMS